MAANLLTVIWRKSITCDEVVLIPSAYYHLVAGNFQLVHEHPPLAKIIAAIPLLIIQPDEADAQTIAAATEPGGHEWAYVSAFWHDNRARFEAISFWTRVPMILLALALGVLIFYFARELFGARAAALSVLLFSLEPTVLAHARVVQTDIPATFGFLLVLYTLYRYLLSRTWQRAAWVGVASGVALLAKFSMLIVAPSLFAVFLVLLWRAPRYDDKRSRLVIHGLAVVMISLVLINASYYFNSRPLTIKDAQWVLASFPKSADAVWTSVRLLKHFLPTDYVLGVYWQLLHNREGQPASLLGMYGRYGWWYYFPVAFALKTTIPFLALSLTSLIWAVYKWCRKREHQFLVLLIPFALYTAFVMTSRINIGVRYFLPAFPFLFILGGAFLNHLLQLRRARRAGLLLTILLSGLVCVEAVRAYPDHMSYMNQLAWQHPHWHYLSDSNVEWGDDVPALATYLRARGETKVRAVLLGGFATLGHYDVEYLDAASLPDPAKPETRYVALGASFLNGSTVPNRPGLSEQERIDLFDPYRHRAPEAIIGGSIYLYRMHE